MIEDINDARLLQQLIHTQEVQEAFETLDLSTLSEDQIKRMLFEEQVRQTYSDLYQERITHEKHQKAIEIALNSLRQGLDPTIIASITGLSEDDIAQLRKSIVSTA